VVNCSWYNLWNSVFRCEIRKRKRKGKTEYLVSFDGRSDKNNQWIPEKDIINEKEQDK
jgi:hypothetical protein